MISIRLAVLSFAFLIATQAYTQTTDSVSGENAAALEVKRSTNLPNV